MPSSVSITELRKLSTEDLLKEIAERKNALAKQKLAMELGAEKDSAVYKRAKKVIARYLTVLQEKYHEPLKDEPKTSTVSASKKKAPSKKVKTSTNSASSSS